MKKKLLNNIGLKLISVLVAMLIWLVITNIDDATTTETITLPIQEINAEDLESYGMTYEVVSGTTATATIKGRPSVLKNLTADDFVATADLSNLSVTGAVMVDITAKDYVRYVEIIPDNNVYKVVTEKLVSKQFPVNVKTRGNVATGYYLGEIKSTPNLITITGSETKINSIKEVAVEVDVTGCSANISKEGLTPVVYSLNGEVMETDRLTFDSKSVDVSIAMLRTKTVPVEIEYQGEPAEGYAVVSKECATTEVLIAGTKTDLDSVSSIKLVCDISGIKEKLETTILYKDFLPANIYLAEGDLETTGAAVTVNVEPYISRTVSVPKENITIQNKSEQYSYTLDGNDTVDVTVSGLSSDIAAVTPENLKAFIDVNGLGAGEHSVLMNISDKTSVKLQENYTVTVWIENKDNNEN
jgi:YbbR domain-containing protein